jgi:hypothetical protein
MPKLLFVSAVAALLAATGFAAAQQRMVNDPPGAVFQDQGFREIKGYQPHPARTVPRVDPSNRAPARRETARRKRSN